MIYYQASHIALGKERVLMLMYVLGCIFYFIAQKEHKIVVWKSYRFFLFPVIVHYCFPWHPVSLILYLPIHSMC